MKQLLFFSLLFLLVSCGVATKTAHVDKSKQTYMDSVFYRYPDASIVGLSGQELLTQLERYRSTNSDTGRLQAGGINYTLDSLGNAVGTLSSDVLFDFDKAEIKEGQQRILDAFVTELMAVSADNVISLVGHTDDKGTDEYNYNLSQRRANAVADYIRNKYPEGITVQSVLGLGESKPVAPNDTPEGRAKNRRVEIIINNGRK